MSAPIYGSTDGFLAQLTPQHQPDYKTGMLNGAYVQNAPNVTGSMPPASEQSAVPYKPLQDYKVSWKFFFKKLRENLTPAKKRAIACAGTMTTILMGAGYISTGTIPFIQGLLVSSLAITAAYTAVRAIGLTLYGREEVCIEEIIDTQEKLERASKRTQDAYSKELSTSVDYVRDVYPDYDVDPNGTVADDQRYLTSVYAGNTRKEYKLEKAFKGLFSWYPKNTSTVPSYEHREKKLEEDHPELFDDEVGGPPAAAVLGRRRKKLQERIGQSVSSDKYRECSQELELRYEQDSRFKYHRRTLRPVRQLERREELLRQKKKQQEHDLDWLSR